MMTWWELAAWLFGGIFTVFILLPMCIAYLIAVRQKRQRREMHHILGVKEWWGRR